MLSPINVATLIGLYIILAFFYSALLVRFAGRCDLARTLRRHFYLFPVVPLVTIILVPLKSVWCIAKFAIILLRFLFEKLSGKKTKRKIKYYTFFFGG